MHLLLILALLCFEILECARPRSVNLALETVLEFDKDADIAVVDTVQNFLTKLKSTIEESRFNAEDTRRSSSMKFTDFFEQLIDVLKSYNDIDLASLLDAVQSEINETDYGNCEDETSNEYVLRKFLHDQLSDLKNTPASDLRRNLDDTLRKLRDEEYTRDSLVYGFFNSLFKKSSYGKFKDILNNLQLFRRREADTNILRSIVKKSIGLIVAESYCQLNKENRRDIKQLLKYFLNSKLNSKSDIEKNSKNPTIRLKKKDRKKKVVTEVKERNKQSQLKHIRGKNENTREDALNTMKNYKKIEDVKKSKENERKPLKSFYDKNDDHDINSNGIKDYKKNIINVRKRPAKKSNEFIKKRKRKTEITKQSTVDDNYAITNEYKSTDSNEFGKKRKRFKIKDRHIPDLKRKRKNKKSNLKFLAGYPNTIESEENKNKRLKKESLSEDGVESDLSKDNLPPWIKYRSKKPTTIKLKTFITLYPERIDIYRANPESTKDRRITTDTVKKRFKIMSGRDERRDIYNVITTNAEIDIDIDKSLLKPQSSYPENKRYEFKNASSRRKDIKSGNKKHMKSKSTTDYAPTDSDNSVDTSVETSSFSNATYDGSSAEYFGNLYSHKNEYDEKLNKRETSKINSYRKSNDNELQLTTKAFIENVTNNAPNKTENVAATKNVDHNFESQSEEKTTRTFGTLAFWGGREKSTDITTSKNVKNITVVTEKQTTASLVKNTETTIESNFSTSTPQIFRSQLLNETKDSRKSTNINETNEVDENKINNNSNMSVIPNNTSYVQKIKNATSDRQDDVTINKNGTNANVTKQADIRRYLENMEINEVEDSDKKKEVELRMREDLEKLLMPTTTKHVMDPGDAIDELEDAFNL